MNQADRMKTYWTTKLKVHVASSISCQIQKYLYQHHQHNKLYKIMYMKIQIMRFEFHLVQDDSWWIRVFKAPKCPDLLPQLCYKAWCTNWQLETPRSSSNWSFHVHVQALDLHDSWPNSSIQWLNLHQWCMINQIMQEFCGIGWRNLKIEEREISEGNAIFDPNFVILFELWLTFSLYTIP